MGFREVAETEATDAEATEAEASEAEAADAEATAAEPTDATEAESGATSHRKREPVQGSTEGAAPKTKTRSNSSSNSKRDPKNNPKSSSEARTRNNLPPFSSTRETPSWDHGPAVAFLPSTQCNQTGSCWGVTGAGRSGPQNQP